MKTLAPPPIPHQAELPLDLGGTAGRISVAPSLRITATADGLGVVMRMGTPEVWIGTRDACAMLGVDKHRLYELGRLGEIDGEQPGKSVADTLAGAVTNHAWRWNSVSVLAYRERLTRARVARMGR